MNRIQVLDCTLRDGGYCNNWEFGYNSTKKITKSLVDANVDIIECGFLTNKEVYHKDRTQFTTLDELASVIPDKRDNKKFVAMLNYGEYDIDKLPVYDGTSIDGLRIAFHKRDLVKSLELCEQIKAKGYMVFVQAMVSLSYTDEEFLSLIRSTNDIEPYAFYIVDSFGMMKRKDLTRLFYMVEHNLKEGIWIGFHSHNNMQLAYSNAQSLADAQTARNIVIDSSIHGMGRGAGNLNTELFVEYLNDNNNGSYYLKPLLTVIDEVLSSFYEKNYWGYSLPNYLSAAYNTHPNYSMFLEEKNTLTIEDMDEIFSMMENEKRVNFDKAYIENLYIEFQSKLSSVDTDIKELSDIFANKKVILIAPGKSVKDNMGIFNALNIEDYTVMSVNFNCDFADTDYIFISNLRRQREMDKEEYSRCIYTSNLSMGRCGYSLDYSSLLNDVEYVKDNAGLMAIKFLISVKASEILLFGFDGYSHDRSENYLEEKMIQNNKNNTLDLMNKGMNNVLKQYSKEINIQFLSASKHLHV